MANITDTCTVKPIDAFLSTNLNNRTKTFDDLAEKIMYALGWPSQSIELHRDQVYNTIQVACEFFTRYAGHDEEYLVFDSRLYKRDHGIRIDKLCTIASDKAADDADVARRLFRQTYNNTIKTPERNYVVTHDIPLKELPSFWNRELKKYNIVTTEQYDKITTYNPGLCQFFAIDKPTEYTIKGQRQDEPVEEYENAYDYDIMDYRRVSDVTDYKESSNRNMTSLFSFESALAAQAYYEYQFSSKGFDLLSFHTLQEFLKTRNRVLALERTYRFNPRTQMFTLSPQPRIGESFYGVITCKIEWPLRNILDRIWIYKYALAQCKVILGTIRGRYGQIQLAGGGTFADNINLRASGEQEMKDLEKELTEGTAFSERPPSAVMVLG